MVRTTQQHLPGWVRPESRAGAVLYQETYVDDLPEDFPLDVVEREGTLLLTYGCGRGREGQQEICPGYTAPALRTWKCAQIG